MMPKFLSILGASVLISASVQAQIPAPATPPTTTTTTTTTAPIPKALADLLAPTPKPDMADIARKEAYRRSHLLDRARQSMNDGSQAMSTGNYDLAATDFQDALDSVTESGKSQAMYSEAATDLAAAKSQQAQVLAKEVKFQQANDLLEQAIALDPYNPLYPNQVQQLKEAQQAYEDEVRNPEGVKYNPAVTDEFKDRVATTQKLLFQGDSYFKTGQYEAAETTYSKVLILDPYNKAARSQMDHMEKYRQRAANERREQAESQAMLNVNQGWENRISPDLVVKDEAVETKTDTSNRAVIAEKLNSIHLDHVQFQRADITQVIAFLNGKVRELDPAGQGVNFVLRLTTNSLPPARPAPGAPVTAATNAAANPIHREVSGISLDDISVAQFLNIVTSQTNLQYTIDDYAVSLRPSVDEGEFLNVRTYLAPPGLFEGAGLTAPPAGLGAGGPGTQTTITQVSSDVRPALIAKGVPFPENSSAIYLAGSSKLVVRNSPENLDLIATIIDQASQETPEVQIEAKVAEFNQDAIKGISVNTVLGFGESLTTGGYPETGAIQGQTALRNSFFLGEGNGGLQQNSIDALIATNNAVNGVTTPLYGYSGNSENQNVPSNLFLGGVIDKRGYGVIVNLINNMTGVSLLSAPIVTTENNQEAKVEIVQEFPYPTQFALPQLNNQVLRIADGDRVTMGVPPTPSAFKVQDLGVLLDVKPTTYPDQRIDLDVIHAQVIDFDGFIDYGQPIVGRSTIDDPTAPGTTLTPAIINQPVFNNRLISTRLQVLDGQTAVLGGLVREDTQEINDKVPLFGDLPIIGRAFQSKVSERIKKNLVFFITADLIRPNGKPQFVHTLTAEPEENIQPPDLGPGLTLPAATNGNGS